MRKMLEQCPTCGGPLTVTEVQCQRCRTQVRSQYSPCPFCALTADQLLFVRLFIEKRGNLRDMEKALGVSYPTVRGKLEEIAERLSGAPAPTVQAPAEAAEADRREVLRLVAQGELTPKEALARLRGASRAEGEPSPEA